ncbi:MAG: FAD-dependent oxidoreductase, partial [Clostridia bacterium]|nr:FAD-dependent oxidoreductase [Clostridia bacterium]
MREVFHTTDFCIIGGGLSGVCAAVSAARRGVRVVLMQDRPMLGGNASSEIRMWVCGANDRDHDYREAGILEEIELENYYRNPTLNYHIWDTVIYEKVMLEENITLLLNCTCQTCEMQGDRIKSVRGWQMTSETYHTVEAKYFADCSGDSILAPLTGARFRAGREARDEFGESIAPVKADSCTMGLSCMFQIRETDRKQTFIPPEWAYSYPTDADIPDREHNIGTNYWWIEVGGDRDSIHDTDELRHELLKISYGVWDHCKNHGHPEYDNWVLDWIGFLPGKRESRRYVGDYILTQNDVLSGGHFGDIVAYGGWTMDDHFPAGFYYRGGYPTIHHYAPVPWGIPWRSLYSVNIENLLFAGRNISCTHTAMSSSRVMGTCSIVGQAVGTGVSLLLEKGNAPRDLDVKRLQQELMYDDCLVPYVERTVPELTLKARTNAEITRNGTDR